MSQRKYTVDQIEAALRAAGGVRAGAASMLAKASGRGCSRRSLDDQIAKSAHLQEVLLEVREINLDLCDRQLLKLIQAGNLGAIIWYQKCFGRDRGYAQITPPDDRPNESEHLRAILLDAIRTTTEIFPDDGDRIPTTIDSWAVPKTGDPPAAG